MVALARSPRAQPKFEDMSAFQADVLTGLHAEKKRLPPKYFYDGIGSQLFERITELPEYYPTRCEMQILREACARHRQAGSARCRADRIRQWLEQEGAHPAASVAAARRLRAGRYLWRDGRAGGARIAAGFPRARRCCRSPPTSPSNSPLPQAAQAAPVRVGFFPGSTIGNFEPHEAAAFLRNAARILGAGATLIVGADLIKPVAVLNAAYNDAAGVTAKFNLNLLVRINRELGGTFKLDTFEHHAFYNRERHRIEMHLASLKRQKVKVAGKTIEFRAGETIHTENSYKYSVESLGRAGARRRLAAGGGVDRRAPVFLDPGLYAGRVVPSRQTGTARSAGLGIQRQIPPCVF